MILNKDQIYILDDEEGVRRSLETILSAEGYDVKAFPSGTDFLRNIQELSFTAPAVALLDLRLPDMSGISVMQKLKQKCGDTEAVMLTGNPDLTSAIEAINAGAYAYILKPYNIDELKVVMARIFEKQKLVLENQQLMQKLKEWNEKLEDEVYRRTVALQESYKKLQVLYDMRTQFVTIMSHELRTPTTALMGFSDTLRDRWETLPKEKVMEYLNVISSESGRMVSLMSELFEISKIQEGKLDLNLELTNVADLVSQIVSEFRSRYPRYSFAYTEKSGGAEAKVDSIYFKSAISHILTNAVKYSIEGGHIIILTSQQDGRFSIRIEDDGPGIPAELRGKVFEAFFRSMDDVNRKTPGAGLGLTIAKGIFERMNGSVRIDQKLTGGKGCAVVVDLVLING